MWSAVKFSAAIIVIATAAVADTQTATPEQEASIRAYWNGCPFHDERLPEPEDNRRRAEELRINAILARGSGDPLGDARKAADAGDFRLFWASSLGGTSVMGATCRFPQYSPTYARSPFTRGTVYYSDVANACERIPNGCEIERRKTLYASTFNRAMLADPRFPYPDLCTTARRTGAYWQQPMLDNLGGLAAAIAETEHPRTLAEAVRHGSLPVLSRLLKNADHAELNQTDDFALTPLAWAAIEGRTEAARMLIDRGADPLAGCAPVRGYGHTIPLKIALQLGRRDIAASMLKPDVEERLRPWPTPIIEAAVAGDHVQLVRRIFREDHQRVVAQRLFLLAKENGSPSMISALSDGVADRGEAMLATAIYKKDVALVRQALALKPPVNSGLNSRQSPLGSAILNGGELTDQIVRLLLDAGADPESPAQWENSYPSGSRPNTALVALVANAQRTPRYDSADKVLGTMASQSRALDMLIAAGASSRSTDDNGRPLAVLAAIGRYGYITREELPPTWFHRLAEAGADFNATWQGSSSLDWLDKMGLTNSETARVIAELGGRRIKPVPANLRF